MKWEDIENLITFILCTRRDTTIVIFGASIKKASDFFESKIRIQVPNYVKLKKTFSGFYETSETNCRVICSSHRSENTRGMGITYVFVLQGIPQYEIDAIKQRFHLLGITVFVESSDEPLSI